MSTRRPVDAWVSYAVLAGVAVAAFEVAKTTPAWAGLLVAGVLVVFEAMGEARRLGPWERLDADPECSVWRGPASGRDARTLDERFAVAALGTVAGCALLGEGLAASRDGTRGAGLIFGGVLLGGLLIGAWGRWCVARLSDAWRGGVAFIDGRVGCVRGAHVRWWSIDDVEHVQARWWSAGRIADARIARVVLTDTRGRVLVLSSTDLVAFASRRAVVRSVRSVQRYAERRVDAGERVVLAGRIDAPSLVAWALFGLVTFPFGLLWVWAVGPRGVVQDGIELQATGFRRLRSGSPVVPWNGLRSVRRRGLTITYEVDHARGYVEADAPDALALPGLLASLRDRSIARHESPPHATV